MPLSLKQLTSNTAPIDFTYMGQSVHLDYRPGAFTEKTLALAAQADNLKKVDAIVDRFHDINEELCRLIVKWDFVERLAQEGDDPAQVLEAIDPDDDTMKRWLRFPLIPERLDEVPVMFRLECLSQICGGFTLGEVNGTPSSSPLAVTSSVEERNSSSGEQD